MDKMVVFFYLSEDRKSIKIGDARWERREL